MRLHTNTHTWRSINEALSRAQAAGRVADHVELWICDEYGSRKRARGFEIRLGTHTKIKGDKRGWTNTGKRGANSEHNGEGIYAATYDEWGWFIAELFAVEPDAIFGDYDGRHGFDAATKTAYVLGHDVVTGYPRAG
jgi:hypothetical protein